MTDPETPPPAVLIVEHDVGVRTLLGRLVSQWGCTPLLAESEDRGVRLLREQSAVALVLSDFQPSTDGETVYDHLIRRTSGPAPPVLCTLASARTAPDEVELVPRPFDVTLLRRIIDQHVHGINPESGALYDRGSASHHPGASADHADHADHAEHVDHADHGAGADDDAGAPTG